MNSFNTSIKFINHASVLIRHNAIFLLSDPWYFGTSLSLTLGLPVYPPEGVGAKDSRVMHSHRGENPREIGT